MYSLIIVDYNSILKTLKYIEDFNTKLLDKSLCHSIIVDNNPKSQFINEIKDKSNLLYICEICGKKVYNYYFNGISIIYCNYGENAGFAKANNLGAKISQILFEDDYYLFSNNDILLKTPFNIMEFKKIFDNNPTIGAIGPKVVSESGIFQSPCKKITPFKHLFLMFWIYIVPFCNTKGDLDYSYENKICYWVSGCFMLLKASVFNSVSGFDENTFLYAEEMILSERLLSNGYICYFYNDYHIIHECGFSTKKDYTNLQLMKIRFSSLCYYYKNYRNVSTTIIKLAKINFKLYILASKLKNAIREIL